jgi:hypothetical protein
MKINKIASESDREGAKGRGGRERGRKDSEIEVQ